MTRRAVVALAACAAVLAGAAAAPAPAAAESLPAVTERRALSPRLAEYTMTTPALAAPTRVRVLLPRGYADQPGRRFPVLYLLHGAFDDYRSWTDKGAAEQITENVPAIVVMPDGGQGGWYTNWFNRGDGGPPEWERFHLEQLVPWVDRTFRTVARREGRAVAGLSMGGFGAMSYAARHPDRFVFAASFSGAVDTINNVPVVAIIAIEAPVDGGSPGDQFGDRVAHEVRWRAHNPWDLAPNLRGMELSLAAGDGRRGPYDQGLGLPDPVEQQVHAMTTSLHRRLDDLGIGHAFDDYGPGTHTWPYWQRDLRRTMPALLRTFADPPARPDPFTHTAAERRYAVDGWTVAFDGDPEALAFSTLREAGRRGFTLLGRGTATVTTAPLHRPCRAYAVRVGDATRVVRSDAAGRLRVRLDLGTGDDGSAQVRVGAPRRTGRATCAAAEQQPSAAGP